MRTACPASSRCLGCARLPLTRNSPFRMMRWMWEKASPGNRASTKRSTRMPASSAVALVVCTPVAGGARSATSGRPRRGVATGLTMTIRASLRKSATASLLVCIPGDVRIELFSPAPVVGLSLPSQLRPIFQPLPDLAFEAALGWVVELLPSQLFGEIVLPGKRLGRFVIVVVAFAIALRLHQLGRRVEDVLRRQQRACLPGGA